MKIAKTNYKKVKVSLQHGVPTVEVSINKQKRRGSWLVIAITGRLTRFAIQKPLCPIYPYSETPVSNIFLFCSETMFCRKSKRGKIRFEREARDAFNIFSIYFDIFQYIFNIFSIYSSTFSGQCFFRGK